MARYICWYTSLTTHPQAHLHIHTVAELHSRAHIVAYTLSCIHNVAYEQRFELVKSHAHIPKPIHSYTCTRWLVFAVTNALNIPWAQLCASGSAGKQSFTYPSVRPPIHTDITMQAQPCALTPTYSCSHAFMRAHIHELTKSRLHPILQALNYACTKWGTHQLVHAPNAPCNHSHVEPFARAAILVHPYFWLQPFEHAAMLLASNVLAR